MSEQALNPTQMAAEAKAAYDRGEYESAASIYQAAVQAYQAVGEPLMAAEMVNNSSVAWLQSGAAEKALEVVVGTDAVFAEAGDIRRQAMALGNRASALEALKRLDEAMALYQQSADLLQQAGLGELRAYVMQAISKIQFRTGRQFEALASMQAGLEGIPNPSLKQRFLRRLLRLPLRNLGVR
jgi:tetratricopeptide (TPR) repeat protein